MTLLEVRGLVVEAGLRKLLAGVSLSVHPGELVAVIGPNGAGKSTLLRAIAGLRPASQGEISLGGRPLPSLTRREIAARLAVVPQQVEIARGHEVRSLVATGRAPFQGSLLLASADDRRRVDEAIERCSLRDLADRPFERLSGGEQRRVIIARGLAQAAPLLALDEPASSLDLRHAYALYALLRREVDERGLGVLLILHDLNAAARFADRVIVLDQGAEVASGVARDVLRAPLLSRVFGLPLHEGEAEGRRFFVPTGPG
jgi:iron complex transport system ATP-binding protein